MPYTATTLHLPDADISPEMPTHALHAHTAPAQPAAYALAATRATQPPAANTAELSMSIALHPPASTSINRRVPGQPTGSHELEPGPFHRANAALRRQLPLCDARVRVAARWDHIAVYAAAALALGAYAGVRFADLVFGRGAGFAGQDVSAALSWVALLAEVLGGLAGLYARPLFWKQTVEYTPIPEEDVEDMATVRRRLLPAAAVATSALCYGKLRCSSVAACRWPLLHTHSCWRLLHPATASCCLRTALRSAAAWRRRRGAPQRARSGCS